MGRATLIVAFALMAQPTRADCIPVAPDIYWLATGSPGITEIALRANGNAYVFHFSTKVVEIIEDSGSWHCTGTTSLEIQLSQTLLTAELHQLESGLQALIISDAHSTPIYAGRQFSIASY
ncbi:hypothetical protein N9W78_00615 [bacterium]|nr:hypothetical protein [bacterium]